MEAQKPIITPKTKVGDILDHFPGAEELLISLVPVFSKLKNPLLRKTIARVTTLQQAAAVGGIDVSVVVNKLREFAGQEQFSGENTMQSRGDVPSWFNPSKIKKVMDARPVIASGGHPLADVMHDAQALKEGEIYELITPFYPAPLVDKIQERGFFSHSVQTGPDLFNTYFIRK